MQEVKDWKDAYFYYVSKKEKGPGYKKYLATTLKRRRAFNMNTCFRFEYLKADVSGSGHTNRSQWMKKFRNLAISVS